MDRVVRIEAHDLAGELLRATEFRFYVDGALFGYANDGMGFAMLQIEGDAARIEAEAIFAGEVKRIAFAPNADRLTVTFDPDRRPPNPPEPLHRDDPQKQRWGGMAERNGRRLGARLIKATKRDFLFDLFIESRDGTPLSMPVRFHLHDSFGRAVQNISKPDSNGTRAAWREIRSEGTFVAGAQVRDAAGKWVGLEYDLNELPDLPQRLKDRKWVIEDRARRKHTATDLVVIDSSSRASQSYEKNLPLRARGTDDGAQILPGQLKPADRLKLQNLLFRLFAVSEMFDLLLGIDQDMSEFVAELTARKDAARAIVIRANDHGWLHRLVQAMRVARPGQPELIAFAERCQLLLLSTGMAAGQVIAESGRALEDMVRPLNAFIDMMAFRRHMSEVELRVCRIEYPANTARGTGFLVGPDLVITNYHVVERLFAEATPKDRLWDPAGVVLRFDYKALPDGLQVNAGTPFRLHRDWNVAASPYSIHDLEDVATGIAGPDELDFAILRLAESPGSMPVLPHDANSPLRGWITVPNPAARADFLAQKSMLVVQHPEGRPMQLAIDTDSVGEVVAHGTRLRHRTNTQRGSSGSPCFDSDWNWVALHHSGDPKYRLRFNQAILVSAIVAYLEKDGRSSPLVADASAGS